MSAAPKRRRRVPRGESPPPVHYIDLTADSPMSSVRQTRGRGSQANGDDCNESTSTNSSVSTLGVRISLVDDTIVIDSAETSPAIEVPPRPPTRRPGRPRRRPLSATSPTLSSPPLSPSPTPPELVGPVIDLDAITLPSSSPDTPNKLIPQINDSVDGSPTVLTCPVCFEDLRASRKPTTTKCGHIFCEECIVTTLKTQKKCPKCNGPITRKSCHRIYF